MPAMTLDGVSARGGGSNMVSARVGIAIGSISDQGSSSSSWLSIGGDYDSYLLFVVNSVMTAEFNLCLEHKLTTLDMCVAAVRDWWMKETMFSDASVYLELYDQFQTVLCLYV